jgi:hypothetical protein
VVELLENINIKIYINFFSNLNYNYRLMIKNYILKGIQFQTITVPKGTILFRGINFENEHDYLSIFNDLLGYKTGKYFGIDSNMNVFFYPVPYVSDSVKIYDIHIMYITQYDVELLLMINPSNISRENKENDTYNKIITTCINLSKRNKCGQEMSTLDPCFTDDLLKRFPQIDGYIGIAEQDASLFTRKYTNIIEKYRDINKAKQILPSILMNSRGITGIPEIVIHPYRFRHDDCTLITEKFYSPESVVKYCVNKRAHYNFFPLLYFTNNGIYTITDLKYKDIIKKLADSVRIYDRGKPEIYENIDNVFSKMLDGGYTLNKVTYNALIDMRTGFYKVYINSILNATKRNTQKKIIRNFKGDNFEGYIIKSNNDPRMNTIVSTHKDYLDRFIDDLGANGYTIKRKLVLDRGNKLNFMYKYYIDKVLDRPDLNEIKNMRKRKKNITNKKTNSMFRYILDLNGFDMDNMSSISSIDSYSI